MIPIINIVFALVSQVEKQRSIGVEISPEDTLNTLTMTIKEEATHKKFQKNRNVL